MELRSARRLRVVAAALLVAWFFVGELRQAVPIWIPFVLFAALELHFLVDAWRERGSVRAPRGRAPQAADVEELGGKEWLEPVLVDVAGHDVWLPSETEDEQPPAREVTTARRRFARFEGIAVLGVLALVLFVLLPDRGWRSLDEAEQARTEVRLSSEAARIAGHEARVRCDAEGEAVGIVQHADGLAEVGGANAYLTPDICYRLHRLAYGGDEGPFSQTARAIAVLAHEAWHLRGESDEGIVNCYAFQSGVELGERLGLSSATAARMMRQQLAENSTFARAAPEYLVPGECRDGGRLDLDPEESRFP